jgi:hypothetical protein
MENNVEQVVDQTVEDTAKSTVNEPQKPSKPKQLGREESDVIKLDLREFNKPQEEEAQEETNIEAPEETFKKTTEETGDAEVILQEVTIEEESSAVQEAAETLEEELSEAISNQADNGVELPENIQKLVDFVNDTGGSLEDYVRLNQDYSKLDENQLLREYYEATKPHLDKDDIEILMEDFSYDEELDDEREIRKAKIAFKEEVAKAKSHLDNLKTQYYNEVKAGSKLNPEQQKAVEFFNRYNKEQKETSLIAEKQKNVFLKQTEDVFSNDFKGFDYEVGDKKYRFNIKNPEEVKQTQSDINNFVRKFLNEKNEMANAKGYHKSLFTAMNPDMVAKHFYEQGKTDAIKESMARTKNVDMSPRGSHEKVASSNGWTVKAINGEDASRLKIKIKK